MELYIGMGLYTISTMEWLYLTFPLMELSGEHSDINCSIWNNWKKLGGHCFFWNVSIMDIHYGIRLSFFLVYTHNPMN